MTEQFGTAPKWGPDGDTVYFRGRENKYWAVTLSDHAERVVADLSGKRGVQCEFAVAPDDEYIFFTWEDNLGDIWVMDVITDESEWSAARYPTTKSSKGSAGGAMG